MALRLIILLVILVRPISAVADEILDVVTFFYPPYMMEEAGKISGFHIDVFEECLKPMGIKPRYRVYPIRRATMEFLKSDHRKLYAHLGTAVNFRHEINSGEVQNVTLSIGKFKAFIRTNSPILSVGFANIAQLRPYNVAALRGSAIVPILKEKGIVPLEVSDVKQLFKVLNAGRVDVSVTLELAGDFHLQKNPNLQLRKLPAVLAEAPLSFLISKSHPQYRRIVPLINERLKSLKESGQLQTIGKKYGGSF